MRNSSFYAALVVVLTLLSASFALAKVNADEVTPSLPPQEFGPPSTIKFRVGAEITASRGACRGIVSMVTVPLECPEQQVTILAEDISPEVREATFRSLPGGEVKQFLISVPQLPRDAVARAIVTCEVTTRPILPPENTEDLVIPKKLHKDIRGYTSASPYIESRHQRVRSLSKEVLKDVEDSITDWERIEKIYDWVLENIEYVEGPDKPAIDTIRDGQADCQGRSAVFVALCRANNIPARIVWVDGHVYPEFYMEHRDDEGKKSKTPLGRWYPCESAGSRAFGEMPLARTILQKGDNFRVPEHKDKNRLRYATDYTIGLPSPGGGKPKVKYYRDQIVDGLQSSLSNQPSVE